MLRAIFAFVSLLFVIGCSSPRYSEYYTHYEDGRAKPIVAFIPVNDESQSGLCWSLSEEFTQSFYEKALDDATLFLIPRKAADAYAEKWKECSLFGRDISFAQDFRKGEYVVLMELIEHRIAPYERGKVHCLYTVRAGQCDSVLMMKLRVRIIDVRCPNPVVVLQEIIESNHMIPRDLENLDYTQCCWGSDNYSKTPYGNAHSRMISDVLHRVSDVIYSTK